MAPAKVIDKGQAHAIIKKVNKGQATLDELAKLELWYFYRRPTRHYEFMSDRPHKYALSEYGDRLGIIRPSFIGWYIDGDNAITYYAQGDNLKLDHTGKRASIRATARRQHWDELAARKTD